MVKLDFLYPSEGIQKRWDNGYRITATADTFDQSALILSILRNRPGDETQETLCTSQFPSAHVNCTSKFPSAHVKVGQVERFSNFLKLISNLVPSFISCYRVQEKMAKKTFILPICTISAQYAD
ncbi:hypothetical protein RYX36_024672 [Vicia faba]